MKSALVFTASRLSDHFSAMGHASGVARPMVIAALATSTVVLTACYVVPVQPTSSHGQVIYTPAPPPQYLPPIQVAPPATTSVTFAARLYPANELATSVGMVGAVVTNDFNGRGTFSTNINGESFTGEATRSLGSSREGIANGAGNRGSYINCRYQMNSTTLGSGTCKLSSGALFTMHVGG